MPDYPVRLRRDYYLGSNTRHRNRADRDNALADRIERYLNEKVGEEQDEGTEERYSYSEIAMELNVDENRIYKMLADIDDDYGSYSVRVYRPPAGSKRRGG